MNDYMESMTVQSRRKFQLDQIKLLQEEVHYEETQMQSRLRLKQEHINELWKIFWNTGQPAGLAAQIENAVEAMKVEESDGSARIQPARVALKEAKRRLELSGTPSSPFCQLLH